MVLITSETEVLFPFVCANICNFCSPFGGKQKLPQACCRRLHEPNLQHNVNKMLRSSFSLFGLLPKHRITQTLPLGSLARVAEDEDREAQKLLDQLYTSIRSQRFEDIVVIQTKLNANPRYLILASAFNPRHLISGTESVNKNFKINLRQSDEEFARISISRDWNVIDFDRVVAHLFSRKCRDHFDVEQLWSCGEKYDDLVNGLSGFEDGEGYYQE